MLRVNKIWSQDIAGICHSNDPLLATSQHQREAKPWYVCPRYPWSHGYVCDPGPFVGTAKRRLGDNPGGLVQAGFVWGLAWGIGTCVKDTLPSGPDVMMPSAQNRHNRLGNEWAMRRMGFVWMMRPAILGAILTASYAVPKELFQQNFGRKNKRGFFDHVPHLVGMMCLYPTSKVILGNTFARSLIAFMATFGLMYDGAHYMGHNIANQQREMTYPIVLASLYGLPNGGQDYDNFAGGEHGKLWRLESTTESMFVNGKNSVGTSARYDDHPLFKQEWGQSAYFS